MFNLFRKKSEIDVLNDSYERLLKESYKLSKINRAKSDEKFAQAEAIKSKIEQLHLN